MEKIPFLFEDMIRVENENLICRIWREVPAKANPVTNSQLKRITNELLNADDDLSIREIVLLLIGHDNVNSVEVIDRKTGDGLCLHKDWP